MYGTEIPGLFMIFAGPSVPNPTEILAKDAAGAITQIREKEYCRSLEEYHGKLLLVGINYDKKTKEHSCKIEEYRK